jgi:YebC/PmpR family DNA-binding regulatory protein
MSGHSKWSTIKRKKGAQDAKRGALFSKLARQIEIAARHGSDPETNFRLKLAIQKARAANMPNTNIEKAIKKGSGEDKSVSQLEEVSYEGIGPGNIAVIVHALTDNKNRTVSELRHIFTKQGGNFGTSVDWQFEQRGILQITKDKDTEEQELAILDSGASDFSDEGDVYEVYTSSKQLDSVRQKLEDSGVKVKSSELGLVAKNKVEVSDASTAKQALNFLDMLEEHDDVVEVYSNLDVSDEILNELR